MVRTLCRPAAHVTLTALAFTAAAVMWPGDHAVAQTAPVFELRRVIDVQIKPDSVAAWKESVLESLKEANVTSYAVLQNVFGGDPNQYRTVLAFQTHEAASSAHAVDPIAWLEGAHGPYGVERMAKEKGSPIAKIERTIIQYVPDLSYRPAVPAAGPTR